jgi:hypothetical protein
VRDWRIDLPQDAIARIERDLEERHGEAQRAATAGGSSVRGTAELPSSP